MTSTFLTVNNIRIYVEEKNESSDTALVFIHGRALSLKSWEKQVNSDMLAPFRIVAFDLPGHGQSGHAASSAYSIQSYIRVLAEVINQLQLKQFFLVGHSLGGHIALEAMPYLAGCQGVFALTMPVTKLMQFDKMYLNGDLLSKVYAEKPAPNDVSTYAQSLLRPHASELPDFLESDFYRTDPTVHTGIIEGILAGEYEDETDIIRTSNLPVAIAIGNQEQIHNLSYLQEFDLPLWQGKPLLVPDAGHLLQWENPELVNHWIRLFVDQNGTD